MNEGGPRSMLSPESVPVLHTLQIKTDDDDDSDADELPSTVDIEAIKNIGFPLTESSININISNARNWRNGNSIITTPVPRAVKSINYDMPASSSVTSTSIKKDDQVQQLQQKSTSSIINGFNSDVTMSNTRSQDSDTSDGSSSDSESDSSDSDSSSSSSSSSSSDSDTSSCHSTSILTNADGQNKNRGTIAALPQSPKKYDNKGAIINDTHPSSKTSKSSTSSSSKKGRKKKEQQFSISNNYEPGSMKLRIAALNYNPTTLSSQLKSNSVEKELQLDDKERDKNKSIEIISNTLKQQLKSTQNLKPALTNKDNIPISSELAQDKDNNSTTTTSEIRSTRSSRRSSIESLSPVKNGLFPSTTSTTSYDSSTTCSPFSSPVKQQGSKKKGTDKNSNKFSKFDQLLSIPTTLSITSISSNNNSLNNNGDPHLRPSASSTKSVSLLSPAKSSNSNSTYDNDPLVQLAKKNADLTIFPISSPSSQSVNNWKVPSISNSNSSSSASLITSSRRFSRSSATDKSDESDSSTLDSNVRKAINIVDLAINHQSSTVAQDRKKITTPEQLVKSNTDLTIKPISNLEIQKGGTRKTKEFLSSSSSSSKASSDDSSRSKLPKEMSKEKQRTPNKNNNKGMKDTTIEKVSPSAQAQQQTTPKSKKPNKLSIFAPRSKSKSPRLNGEVAVEEVKNDKRLKSPITVTTELSSTKIESQMELNDQKGNKKGNKQQKQKEPKTPKKAEKVDDDIQTQLTKEKSKKGRQSRIRKDLISEHFTNSSNNLHINGVKNSPSSSLSSTSTSAESPTRPAMKTKAAMKFVAETEISSNNNTDKDVGQNDDNIKLTDKRNKHNKKKSSSSEKKIASKDKHKTWKDKKLRSVSSRSKLSKTQETDPDPAAEIDYEELSKNLVKKLSIAGSSRSPSPTKKAFKAKKKNPCTDFIFDTKEFKNFTTPLVPYDMIPSSPEFLKKLMSENESKNNSSSNSSVISQKLNTSSASSTSTSSSSSRKRKNQDNNKQNDNNSAELQRLPLKKRIHHKESPGVVKSILKLAQDKEFVQHEFGSVELRHFKYSPRRSSISHPVFGIDSTKISKTFSTLLATPDKSKKSRHSKKSSTSPRVSTSPKTVSQNEQQRKKTPKPSLTILEPEYYDPLPSTITIEPPEEKHKSRRLSTRIKKEKKLTPEKVKKVETPTQATQEELKPSRSNRKSSVIIKTEVELELGEIEEIELDDIPLIKLKGSSKKKVELLPAEVTSVEKSTTKSKKGSKKVKQEQVEVIEMDTSIKLEQVASPSKRGRKRKVIDTSLEIIETKPLIQSPVPAIYLSPSKVKNEKKKRIKLSPSKITEENQREIEIIELKTNDNDNELLTQITSTTPLELITPLQLASSSTTPTITTPTTPSKIRKRKVNKTGFPSNKKKKKIIKVSDSIIIDTSTIKLELDDSLPGTSEQLRNSLNTMNNETGGSDKKMNKKNPDFPSTLSERVKMRKRNSFDGSSVDYNNDFPSEAFSSVPDPPIIIPVKTNFLEGGLLSKAFKRYQNQIEIEDIKITTETETENEKVPLLQLPHQTSDLVFKKVKAYQLPYDIWCLAVIRARENFEKYNAEREKQRLETLKQQKALAKIQEKRNRASDTVVINVKGSLRPKPFPMPEVIPLSWNFKKIKKNTYFEKPKTYKPTKGKDESLDYYNSCNCPEGEPGELRCNSDDCLNRVVFTECPPSCGENCLNQKIRKHEYATNLKRIVTKDKGFGIFAFNPVKKGDFIIEYVGEIVSDAVFKERMRTCYKEDTHHYCLHLDSQMVIDGHRTGGECRFVNHSCEPNCEMQKWSVNGVSRMALFALRDILPGEELSYDYNFSLFNPMEGQTCYCGSENCRGIIGMRPKNSAKVQIQQQQIQENSKNIKISKRKKSGGKKGKKGGGKFQQQDIGGGNHDPAVNEKMKQLSRKDRKLVFVGHCFLIKNFEKIRKYRELTKNISKLHKSRIQIVRGSKDDKEIRLEKILNDRIPEYVKNTTLKLNLAN